MSIVTDTIPFSYIYVNEYTYENDRLKTVKHNTADNNCDVTYTFGYDALGRKTTVKVGNQVLSTNVYSDDRNGILNEVQYGNGGKVSYVYDDFDRITGIKHDGETSPRYTYEYGANGQAAFMKDVNLGRIHQTEYDLAERPVQATTRDTSGNLIYRTTLTYDGKNRLSTFAESLPTENYKTTYTYDKDNRTTAIQFDDSTHKVAYGYDALGRVSSRAVTNGSNIYTSTYNYLAGSTSLYGAGATTPLVSKITQNGIGFEYTYDSRGNIVSEKRGSLTTTYAYDALGQLIRVNDPHENKTWVYEYDLGGNIKSKKRYAYTTAATPATLESTINYTYGDSNWKDKLTAYNGQTITYDAIGNPLSDGTWTYTWSAGRQLKKMTKSGMTVEFKYNAEGLRTQKKVTEGSTVTTTDYTLHGKLITHQKVTIESGGTTSTSHMHFFYDNDSRPTMFKHNGQLYTYVHNLQGDIVGIVDASDNLVVEYKYDAWGRKLSVSGSMASTLGKLNPFRYRGYVWDEETEMYYLETRYYNPATCRFISPDVYIVAKQDICPGNVYTYCNNNPGSCIEVEGKFGIIATMLIGAAVSLAMEFLTDTVSNTGRNSMERAENKSKAGEYIAAAAFGALSVIPGTGVVLSGIYTIVEPFVASGINVLIYGDEFDINECILDAVVGLACDEIIHHAGYKVPEYVREVKYDAAQKGIKGQKNLDAFLKEQQFEAEFANTVSRFVLDSSANVIINPLKSLIRTKSVKQNGKYRNNSMLV